MSLKNNNTRETKYDAIRFYGELFEKGEAATGSSFFFKKKIYRSIVLNCDESS